MVGHCRCAYDCGAAGRTKAGCSCIGGTSHRCLGGGDPEDLEKERLKKEKEQEQEKENKKTKGKPKDKPKNLTVNVTVNVNAA